MTTCYNKTFTQDSKCTNRQNFKCTIEDHLPYKEQGKSLLDGEKQSTDTNTEMNQTLELSNKIFKKLL